MRSKSINAVLPDVAFGSQNELKKQQSYLMIDSLWVDAWHLLRGAVCSDENIVYDAMGFGDIDRYHFNNGFHIALIIDLVCS
jgi:hypothetical protein